MYQTVGHDAIDFYADCMQLPLYRRDITGTAIAQGANYEVTPQDETEDLYVLLKEVLVSLLCVYQNNGFKHDVGKTSRCKGCLCWSNSIKLSKS